jgi:hypothetical protein
MAQLIIHCGINLVGAQKIGLHNHGLALVVEVQALWWVVVIGGIALVVLVHLSLHMEVGVHDHLRLGLHLVGGVESRGVRIDGN